MSHNTLEMIRDALITFAKLEIERERRDVAAFLLLRADRYDNSNGKWVPLADAAQEIMNGDFAESQKCGELDADLYKRVDSWVRNRTEDTKED